MPSSARRCIASRKPAACRVDVGIDPYRFYWGDCHGRKRPRNDTCVTEVRQNRFPRGLRPQARFGAVPIASPGGCARRRVSEQSQSLPPGGSCPSAHTGADEECGRRSDLIRNAADLLLWRPERFLKIVRVSPEFLIRPACRRPTFPPGEGIWVHSKDDTEHNQDAERHAPHCARIKKAALPPSQRQRNWDGCSGYRTSVSFRGGRSPTKNP